jgi:hypothetical protein
MRNTPEEEKWVVYESIEGKTIGTRSLCSASQWLAIQERYPGANKLIEENITDENVAEKLARGTSGDLKPRKTAPRPKFDPLP